MAAPGPRANAAGAALLYAGFLLDKVDGELARCRGTASIRGILLDRFHHRLVEPWLFAAAAAHAHRHDGDPLTLVAAGACMLFANAIEENQQLAPYILHKHLRQGGALPPAMESPPRWRRLGGWLRPLKALRMQIVALPIVVLAYVGDAVTGLPVTRLYLVGSALGLGAYLMFQCVDYAVSRLQHETRQVAAGFARALEGEPDSRRSLTTSSPAAEDAAQLIPASAALSIHGPPRPTEAVQSS